MSCSSIKHRFEEERQKGLTFERAMEMYREVEGSLAAHRLELEDLQRTNADPGRISHLQAHISDGEKLLQEIKSLHLH
ncbi:hypothetical protein [Desulfofundulus salinus]|uniref:Uncharacterized protein n=1 Tax=Desulfofundulus salinus TaxID=2419843 RepID=A0A494WT78_9FIRM|nr:hypothetical protein [Desulfofundulus salinum]RKO66569.1 hypothetical protein D7024_06135 [Desulfofundulus salinum]